jgi:hypothetical protein
MGFASAYLAKQSGLNHNISEAPSGLLNYIIVIPAFCEPEIEQTLLSIYNQKEIAKLTEVIIVFNFSESDPQAIKEDNIKQHRLVSEWISTHTNQNIKFYAFIAENLPAKFAGAGFARKIAMDMAVKRFNTIDNPSGILLSVDADTILPNDYLLKIDLYCNKNKNINTLIFNFEHEISGRKYSSKVYQAITQYELHLRYFKHMLEYIRFPYSYYTIGSCFGIRAGLYSNVGGMSKRKAGEDFYFLHKVFPFEHVHFFKDIVLNPSSRPSWRVPFGTGPEIRKLISSPAPKLETYHPDSFEALKKFLCIAPSFYESDKYSIEEKVVLLNDCLVKFLKLNNYLEKILEIKKNSASQESYNKRFLNWVNAFFIIKFLNYSKEKCFPSLSIIPAIKMTFKTDLESSAMELLLLLRTLDKQGT